MSWIPARRGLTDWLTDYSTRFSTARFASHSETLVRRTQQCTMRFRLAPASGAATKPNPKDKLDHSPTGMRTPPIWMYVVDYNALSVVVWWVVMDAPHIPGPALRYDARVIIPSSTILCNISCALHNQFIGLDDAIMNWNILQLWILHTELIIMHAMQCLQAQFCAILIALCTLSSEVWMMP